VQTTARPEGPSPGGGQRTDPGRWQTDLGRWQTDPERWRTDRERWRTDPGRVVYPAHAPVETGSPRGRATFNCVRTSEFGTAKPPLPLEDPVIAANTVATT
jgi:hypothetical protein